MTHQDQKPPNGSQLRGLIDAGETADKTPGADPAAAPMETDAEAGGAPPSGAEVSAAMVQERGPDRPAPNAQSPQLAPDGAMGRADGSSKAAWIAIAVFALVVVIAGLALLT